MIYGAARAFGVRFKGQSLLVHGDFSTLSFHATKLFHTVEGGVLVMNYDNMAHRLFAHLWVQEVGRILGIGYQWKKLGVPRSQIVFSG